MYSKNQEFFSNNLNIKDVAGNYIIFNKKIKEFGLASEHSEKFFLVKDQKSIDEFLSYFKEPIDYTQFCNYLRDVSKIEYMGRIRPVRGFDKVNTKSEIRNEIEIEVCGKDQEEIKKVSQEIQELFTKVFEYHQVLDTEICEKRA